MEMGIGVLGFNNLIFKRKFRYTLALFVKCGGNAGIIPKHFVKLAARPSLTWEETEINHLNAKHWIPGKASWETMTVTYIDVANELSAPLFQWLSMNYSLVDPVNLPMGSKRGDYEASALLQLWDGCGTLLENWYLLRVFPSAVNFGELDYSSSEEATIELTLRYMDVVYENVCPGFTMSPCCTGC